MNSRPKIILMLLGTLLVGGLIGALATSIVHDQRMERLRHLRTREGFTQMIEEVIQVQDEQQRTQIRLVVERADDQVKDHWRGCRSEHAALMDTMRTELAPLLNADQQERMDTWYKKRYGRRQRGERRRDRR